MCNCSAKTLAPWQSKTSLAVRLRQRALCEAPPSDLSRPPLCLQRKCLKSPQGLKSTSQEAWAWSQGGLEKPLSCHLFVTWPHFLMLRMSLCMQTLRILVSSLIKSGDSTSTSENCHKE